MGPFGTLIVGEIIKTIFNGIRSGQVPTSTVDPVTNTPVTKHWIWSRTIWGGLGVLGYVAISIFTGNEISIPDVNSIISNGSNIFLAASAILAIIGRKRL